MKHKRARGIAVGSVVAVVLGLGTLSFYASASGAVSDREFYERFLDGVTGTETERKFGHRNVVMAMQDQTVACMKGKGRVYHPAAYYGGASGTASPRDWEVGTPLSDDFGLARDAQQNAESVELDVVDDGDAGYSDALDVCWGEAMDWESKAGQLVMAPARQAEAENTLADVLAEVQERPEGQRHMAAYAACLQEAGYPEQTRKGLYRWTAELFPDSEEKWSVLRSQPQWTTAVEAEKKAAATDKRCRAKLYDWATREVRPKIEQLLRDPAKAQLFREVERGWRTFRQGLVNNK